MRYRPITLNSSVNMSKWNIHICMMSAIDHVDHVASLQVG